MKTRKLSPIFLNISKVLFAAFFIALPVAIYGQDDAGADKVRTVYVISNKKEQAEITRPRVTVIKNEAPAKNSRAAFDLEKSAFQLINQKRVESGLNPLRWCDEIAGLARQHSLNMADYKFFSHKGLNGDLIDERAVAFGIKKWQAIGENIAFNKGFENPVEFAVERWMQSQSHRQNLLHSRWKESAIGVAVSPDGAIYFTQIFLLK